MEGKRRQAGASRPPASQGTLPLLQRLQERHQIRFLLVRHVQGEALVVELNRVTQGSRRTVMEVRSARCQAAQELFD